MSFYCFVKYFCSGDMFLNYASSRSTPIKMSSICNNEEAPTGDASMNDVRASVSSASHNAHDVKTCCCIMRVMLK